MKKTMFSVISLLFLLSISSFVIAEEEPLFDFPVDADIYIMRPGDRLKVTFINSKIQSLTLTVDPEGNIVDETIGVFDLKNKSFSDAKTELVNRLKHLYHIDEIAISIDKPRTVSIAIHGAVYRPGIYKALTSDRVSDIITKARGIADNGSRRNILFSGGKKEINVDLDRAEFMGDFSSNPNLYAGLSIFVPSKSDQTVQIVGEVVRPREIEFKSNDDLSQLLALVGGLSSYADAKQIKIIRGNKLIEDKLVQSGDIIMVPAVTETVSESKVIIAGAVKNQGLYSYSNQLSLSSLIESAGGYLNDANIVLTTIFRKPRVDVQGRTTELRFPISKPFGGETDFSQTILSPNDSIFVPVKVGFVKVSGEVLNPGYFPFIAGKDIKYYIINAGGFLPTANDEQIMIFNPVSEMTSQTSSGVLVSDGSEIIVTIREELK